jgi:hypothetical protein
VGELQGIDDELRAFLEAQPVFFTATAPLSGDGHVNLSPKGMQGTFAVLGPHRVAYLDLVGSGVETIAHLRENGRITIMCCAFDGPPRIIRLFGRGEPVLLNDPRPAALAAHFPPRDGVPGEGVRSVIVVDVERVSKTCGFGVPFMEVTGERDDLATWVAKQGPDGMVAYQRKKNARSIDGLPGIAAHEVG